MNSPMDVKLPPTIFPAFDYSRIRCLTLLIIHLIKEAFLKFTGFMINELRGRYQQRHGAMI